MAALLLPSATLRQKPAEEPFSTRCNRYQQWFGLPSTSTRYSRRGPSYLCPETTFRTPRHCWIQPALWLQELNVPVLQGRHKLLLFPANVIRGSKVLYSTADNASLDEGTAAVADRRPIHRSDWRLRDATGAIFHHRQRIRIMLRVVPSGQLINPGGRIVLSGV